LIDFSGRTIAMASSAYPVHSPQPGWSEQNPADWMVAVRSAITQLCSQTDIALHHTQAIALTSAAHIAVLLDAQHRVLRPAILWNDQRAAKEAQHLNQTAGQLILEQTCQRASPGWSLAQLAWIGQHEHSVWAAVKWVLLSKDFLAWQLTGEKITDPATAVSSQLFNVQKSQWSDELCAMIGLAPHALPLVYPADHIVGKLTDHVASDLGLPTDIPVINGSLDSATELLAVGCVQPGQSMIRLATAGGVQMVLPHAIAHERRITYPHLITPNWYTQAGTNTCAAAIQWAINLIDKQMTFATAEKLARTVAPGSDKLLFHPYLTGERAPYWNSNLRAGFTHLSSTHTRAHLMRSVYEGTAMSIRDAMGVLDNPVTGNAPVPVVGGGVHCLLWVEILANVLNCPLRCLPDHDSSLGAARLGLSVLAGPSLTIYENDDQTCIINPNREATEQYQLIFERYQHVAQQMHRESQMK
jgi:xylulokinase